MTDLDDTLTIILRTVKEGLGVPNAVTTFDPTIVVSINSVFMLLHELGIGPETVFTLSAGTETWSDFFEGVDDPTYSLVKTYMVNKVKLIFDPPTSGVVVASLERLVTEFESRLSYQTTATS